MKKYAWMTPATAADDSAHEHYNFFTLLQRW